MEFERKYNYHQTKFFDISEWAMDFGRFVCCPLAILYRILARKTDGTKYREQPKGGCLIAANHTCFQDPFYIGILYWTRRCYFMTAEVVMRNKFINFMFSHMGCIRIDRNILDYEALQQAEAALKTGHVLGMFPQGGISREDAVQDVKGGIILLAAKADVPIIPMYLSPRKHWYERSTIIVGDKIRCSDYTKRAMPSMKEMKELNQLLFDRMLECRHVYEEGRFQK